MFSRILIANRGEVALRILRTCREMGIKTVLAHSAADRNSLSARFADQTVCIGPAQASDSYLNIPSVISAAEINNVDAIHPGYGFLAENADFAEVCEASNIRFIGPTARVMRRLCDKVEARNLARSLRIPVAPGSDGPVSTESEALSVAASLGYPVILKSCCGGGGRGLRVAHNDIALRNALSLARNEIANSFGGAGCYIEKCLQNARHIEVQLLGDSHGNLVHMGERECSIQRRHQKLIEETPATGINPDLTQALYSAALKLAKAAGYSGAGTVEFIADRNGNFYFIEMNARLQVEHTITEMVTGVDLVREQIRIAAGEKLSFVQKELRRRGAAIECRINAEDPGAGFRASAGTVTSFIPPGGRNVRVDTHVCSGCVVPPHYDSLLAKIVAWGGSRSEAITTMNRALAETVVEGVPTTIPLYREILRHARFIEGLIDTNFVDSLVAAGGGMR
ncbi:MAG TPA: acetyl-CoA carboxylase biotin carboxylase subunit [Candidatus Brocadiia bacterium]|nr:acetyl-CoA carboxylase biotin carboxylase subunit [Candidatus Brocadiia bacterium]